MSGNHNPATYHTFISPNYRKSDFKSPLSIDDKIKVFEDQVLGWQLDIAVWIMKSGAREAQHSAYAVLHIVLSYFEMYAKYEQGYVKEGEEQVVILGPEQVEVQESSREQNFFQKIFESIKSFFSN